MIEIELTPVQRAALEWLPAARAASFIKPPPRICANALLWLAAMGYAQYRLPGKWDVAAWRLTPEGDAMRIRIRQQ